MKAVKNSHIEETVNYCSFFIFYMGASGRGASSVIPYESYRMTHTVLTKLEKVAFSVGKFSLVRWLYRIAYILKLQRKNNYEYLSGLHSTYIGRRIITTVRDTVQFRVEIFDLSDPLVFIYQIIIKSSFPNSTSVHTVYYTVRGLFCLIRVLVLIMKSFAFLTAGAYGALSTDWQDTMHKKFNIKFDEFGNGKKLPEVSEVDEILEEKITQDTGLKNFIHQRTRSNNKWCPVDPNCPLEELGLHWALCPNMCQMVRSTGSPSLGLT